MSDITPNTSSKIANKTIHDMKIYDIRNKMNLAKHIITACFNQTINRTDISQNDFYKEAQNYITTSNLLMTTILKNINRKEKPKTFTEWFKERFTENSETLNYSTQVLDEALRQSIIDHYVKKQCLPTYVSICNDLKTKNINIDVKEIKNVLKAKGYKLQHLPKHLESIIVEDPEQRFNRMKYLHSIINFREANLHIVYIEEKIMNIEGNTTKNSTENNEMILSLVAVSSLLGIINIKIQNTTLNAATNNAESTEIINDWILNNVLPHLSVPSVIVLENRTNNVKRHVPTINSTKRDMIKWLQQNDLPHTSAMHSAELYELIKRTKHIFSEQRYKFDEILMIHGHKVLRRPRRPHYLNIFETVWSQLQQFFEKKATLIKFRHLLRNSLCSIDVSDWEKLENMLITTENKVYSDDNDVDEVIDKLFTYAKHKTIPYMYIFSCEKDIDELKMAEIVLE